STSTITSRLACIRFKVTAHLRNRAPATRKSNWTVKQDCFGWEGRDADQRCIPPDLALDSNDLARLNGFNVRETDGQVRQQVLQAVRRSEERRVGKECRPGRSQWQYK